MERKLIANYLVPDDEVWVSPETWERPFSLKAKESTVTAHNSAMLEISAQIETVLQNCSKLPEWATVSLRECVQKLQQ